MQRASETWNSRLGVILAVAGSAVGLGNFLRFPGLAAQYGSGAFMIAYFISFLLLGIPLCWAEWTMGRRAGQAGFHSGPGIFHALIRHPAGKYVGALAIVVPALVYMYYVYIEAWCLGYAWYFMTGKLNLGADVEAYAGFWASFIGATQDGLTVSQGHNQVLYFLVAVFALNFFIIYRGLTRGIEIFCKYAMPALILLAVVVLVRVLTLGTPDPARPDRNLLAGLGYMWNPGEIVHQLINPQLWLAAAGQIFFSLSVGFGLIITYASYLKKSDDVVLSGLSASATNEFCEVALGGMITVPAAFLFLGASSLAGFIGSSFSLGFKVMPLVFARMPSPELFGACWFFLLFLAAVTSSLSMLQPGVAFLEEGLGLRRGGAVLCMALITGIGSLFVVYFSKDVKALDTIDFWVGTFLIFVLATVVSIVFGWVMGIEDAWKQAHEGADIRIPAIYKPIMKYVAPVYLLTIFLLWVLANLFVRDAKTGAWKPSSYVVDLFGTDGTAPSAVAQGSVLLILATLALALVGVWVSGKRWNKAKEATLDGKGRSS